MANTVKQSFAEFASRINITDNQVNLVSSRRANVIEALQRNISLHSSTKSLLIGSYDRQTQIRYMYQNDVDVMVILHYGENKEWDSQSGTQSALNKFKTVLDAEYPNILSRCDRNCVTMHFDEFKLDVVPAFKNVNGYYSIPDTRRRMWVKTNPIEYAGLVTTVNKNTDEMFVRLIKMMKAWARAHEVPLRSFHLETMLYNHYKGYTQSYTYSSTIKVFADSLPGYVLGACYDPTTYDRLDGYLGNFEQGSRRFDAYVHALVLKNIATEAYNYEEAGQQEAAVKAWKVAMGSFFPAYG